MARAPSRNSWNFIQRGAGRVIRDGISAIGRFLGWTFPPASWISPPRAQLAAALRVPDSSDEGDGPLLDRFIAVGTAIAGLYAPDAPSDVADEAVIRLSGWLYDRDAAMPSEAAFVQCGAAGLLSRWRVRSVAILPPTTGIVPAVPTDLPSPPESGFFVLAVENGELTWLKFPKPA